MNEAQMREILAQEVEKTRPHVAAEIRAGGPADEIWSDEALEACKRVRDWAVRECAEKIDGVASAIRAVAE